MHPITKGPFPPLPPPKRHTHLVYPTYFAALRTNMPCESALRTSILAKDESGLVGVEVGAPILIGTCSYVS